MCSLCWLVRWFRDWPFVYFSGGFISHLFGDYANINMWKSDYMKAWNSIRNDCGRFVKNQMQRPLKNKRYQETGKEYFTTVQMIVKDEGYKYFAAKTTFDAWSCPPSPPSAPQTHTRTNKKDTVCLMTSAHPTSSPHNLISNSHHDKCTSFLITQLPKKKSKICSISLEISHKLNSTVPIFNKSKISIQT